MKITMFIGNGFDLNIGAKTGYKDFIDSYIKSESPNIRILELKEHMGDKEYWSDIELGLGKYTSHYEKGEGKKFVETQIDLAESLSKYLLKQEDSICFATEQDSILKAFSNLVCVWKFLEPSETNDFEKVRTDAVIVNTICFNYTHTFDKCVDIVKKDDLSLQAILNPSKSPGFHMGEICHVHGSIGEPIVFAVNDETQILNPGVFDCPNGKIYKDLLIKRNANAAYKQNNDSIASKMLFESDLICIYGMSIGPTDGIWWERICNWLSQSDDHRLIIFEYGLPSKGTLPANYLTAVENVKNKILMYSKTPAETICKSRIYVTGENLFKEIKNLKEGLIERYLYKL